MADKAPNATLTDDTARVSTATTATDDLPPDIECAVCLQTCVYPVQLPCKHIFCYLCVKGVTTQSKRCAMCRQEIPVDYLQNPELLSNADLELGSGRGFEEDGQYWQWFYEGRNGWWVYDERTSQDVEMYYKNGDKRCELLIAGFLYIIDFEHMLQYRRNDPSRRRRVKRDVATVSKKGVAGLRIEQEVLQLEVSNPVVDGDTDTVGDAIVGAMGSLGINTDNQPSDNQVVGNQGGNSRVSRGTSSNENHTQVLLHVSPTGHVGHIQGLGEEEHQGN